jgi:hypothetical protein
MPQQKRIITRPTIIRPLGNHQFEIVQRIEEGPEHLLNRWVTMHIRTPEQLKQLRDALNAADEEEQ